MTTAHHCTSAPRQAWHVACGARFAECATGTLPQVSYVDPRFEDESNGTSGDDHPHADIRNGAAFLNAIYLAVTRSPAWSHTVLIIIFDEWGGFFDHVPPRLAPIPPADRTVGSDGRRGFRVPALLIAPWSPRRSWRTRSSTTRRCCG